MSASLAQRPHGADPTAERPDWRLVHLLAQQDHELPRVLALMGFDQRARARGLAGLVERYWPDDARPLFPPDRAAHAMFRERDRAEAVARWMEKLRAECWLMRRQDPRTDVWLRAGWDCSWRDAAGGARGEDLISLGAYMLGISYGQAGWRLARLCGYPKVPLARAR